MSALFLRTLREDPADAELPGHRLLVRAGYLRRAAPGAFTWLPLGKLLLDRITAVVREELAAIGGQEVSFPALLPREPYEVSGRWTDYGPDIFRLRDRRGADYLLAPTHEEMFTTLVRDVYASYRDYPLILFQVQTKFRDEPRPRGGVLRGREFLMKDSYSFDLDDAGLAAAYAKHREAYTRIFDRLGVDHLVVSAFSGAMGGSASEEFQAPSPAGEDRLVSCPACGYAANIEAVTTPAPVGTVPTAPSPSLVDTPGAGSIEALVATLNADAAGGRTDWRAADTLKNVVVVVTPPGGPAGLLVIGVPGDREVDLTRVETAVHPAAVALLDDFASHPELVRGYLGPRNLSHRYLVDPRVAPGTAWVTGANTKDLHELNVVCGRDFTPDGTIEAADVRPGDPCPRCGTGLDLVRGIEIGHIFQLGRRYAKAFGLTATGPDGEPITITMGSYGIGISRLVGVLAEKCRDEHGLCWPPEVAPFDVQLIATGTGDQLDVALDLGAQLSARGRHVLVDDRRHTSAGVKFTDAELIGIPRIVVVGRRLSEGYVELRDRSTGARRDVHIASLVDIVG